jgi:outer membrane receptor protein involved in Fe transport
MRRTGAVRLLAATLCMAVAARAHEPAATEAAIPTGEGAARLEEVVVEAEKPVSAASSDEISYETYELRPHTTLQEILNNVPGLVVRQHQGGGKATQYLIRGFNSDHGTDFLVTVDGLPVNLVTHAHGQGYADVNFAIPETIETLQLRKGPYFPEIGDLGVAGALNLVTRDAFDENFVLAEGGSFDRQRYVAGFSPRLGNMTTLLAAQAYFSNGPFVHPEHFARYNAFAKLTLDYSPVSRVSASGTFYAADWDASGQIPQREVSAGRLDRFGSVDPTEGGRTDRENLDLHWDYSPTWRDHWSVQAWASRYTLRLWSNFTFFQETRLRFIEDASGEIIDTRGGPSIPGADYVPGDGLEQNDVRYLYGGQGVYTRTWEIGALPLQTRVGFQTRNDDIDVALYRQVRRNRFFTVNRVAVEERSFSGFLAQQVFLTDWIRFEGGLRGDVFTFDLRNRLPAQRPDPDFQAVPFDGFTSDSIVSPKANLVLTPLPTTGFYLNFGTGFHSNDARAAIQSEGDPDATPLDRAIGYEIGSRTSQLDGRLDAAAALWLVDLDSEIVFCGDCGFVETEGEGTGSSFAESPSTRRWGVDFETRYRLTRWLYADYDLSFADPRYEETGLAVPIAPTLFMNGGLTAEFESGFSAAFRVRYLDDRPGNEDRTIPARGYLILDLLGKYRWRNLEASLSFLNLADFDWQEAVFVDTSCVRREARGRAPCPSPEDIHFTPGDPFGVRAGLRIFF